MRKFLVLAVVFLVSAVANAKEINVNVKGMVCSMCAQGIQKKFSNIKEVKSINVDLDKKVVKIDTNDGADIQDDQITKIITEAGYNVASIERK